MTPSQPAPSSVMGLYPTSETTSTSPNASRMLFGFIAFLVATPILWVIACNPIFAQGCSEGNPSFAVWCAGLIEILLIALLFWRNGGWRFSTGFFVAFLLAATFSRGRATVVWLAPPSALVGAASPLWAPLAARQKASAAASEWIGMHRTQRPSVVHAARLANLVHECALLAARASSDGGFPASIAELAAPMNCEPLRDLALEAEAARTRFSDADNGWRWSYRPGPPNADGVVATYSMRVLEDPVLERPAPQFAGDESGIIREESPGAAPRFVATPVASLVTLRRCLTRVPAENERLLAQRGWRSGTPALHQVASVCPELHSHIGIPLSDESHQNGLVAVQVYDQPGEFTDTAAVYLSQFIPADVDGLIFEVYLTPLHVSNSAIHPGVRRFLVARDGSVHTTTADRAATINDPIAAECLPGGGVDCSVSGAIVTRTPGS